MRFRLSESDFNQTVSSIQIGDRPKLAARKVLVEGLSLAQASQLLNISKEAIRKSALRVKNAWIDTNGNTMASVKRAAFGMLKGEMKDLGIPNDWEPVVVYLPKSMANTIKNLELDKLQGLEKSEV